MRDDEINGDRKFWIRRVVSANKLTSFPEKHVDRQKSSAHRCLAAVKFMRSNTVCANFAGVHDYRASDLFGEEDLN